MPYAACLACRLIEALVEASRDMGCYKVILDCTEANVAFYEKSGLTRKEIQMVRGQPLTVMSVIRHRRMDGNRRTGSVTSTSDQPLHCSPFAGEIP